MLNLPGRFAEFIGFGILKYIKLLIPRYHLTTIKPPPEFDRNALTS
jgi:hypothetical protein